MRFLMTILTGLTLAASAFADAVTDLRPVINQAAAEHNVDPVLIEAIIRIESGHATSRAAVKKNNLAGIMGRRGQRTYESKEDCVRDLARILDEYRAKGRVTVAQIGRVYCTTGGWAAAVSSTMTRVRSGQWGALEEQPAAEEEAKQQ